MNCSTPQHHSVLRPALIASLLVLLVGVALSFALTGCSSNPPSQAGDLGSSKKLQVVASFYPMYDFTQKIGGDRVEVKNLVPAGTEPHDWEPSTTDIKTLESADMLVYNGADMEHWVNKVLSSLSNKKLEAVEASQGITLRSGSEDGASGESGSASNGQHDPHVWLAPENAKAEMKNIEEALIKIDPNSKDYYEANYTKWANECDKLDQEYKDGLAKTSTKDIVVSHEAFGYLCDAYGLHQIPIEGMDADAEPDAKTMASISDFVKAHHVKVIFSEDLVSPKIAQTIADATGAKMEKLNPIEGLTDAEIAAGQDYFSVMRSNLKELEGALS